MAIYLSGFHAGQRNNPVVDSQAFERNAERVSRYCDSNRNAALMQAGQITLDAGK